MEDFEFEDKYYSAHQKAFIIRQTMVDDGYTSDINNIFIDDIFRYLTKNYKIKLRSYGDFDSVAEKILSGTLFINPDNQKVLISYNKTMPPTRQNFTKLHELIHWEQYIFDEKPKFQYSDLLAHKGYDENNMPDEIEANYGAAALFSTDEYLENEIYAGTSFNRIAQKLKMSESALEIRISSKLSFERHIPFYHAKTIVQKYRFDGSLDEIQIALTHEYFFDEKERMLEAVSQGFSYTLPLNIEYDINLGTELPF